VYGAVSAYRNDGGRIRISGQFHRKLPGMALPFGECAAVYDAFIAKRPLDLLPYRFASAISRIPVDDKLYHAPGRLLANHLAKKNTMLYDTDCHRKTLYTVIRVQVTSVFAGVSVAAVAINLDSGLLHLDFIRDRIANDANDKLQQVVDIFLGLLELGDDRVTVELVLQLFDFSVDFRYHFLVLERLERNRFFLPFFDQLDQILDFAVALHLLLGFLVKPDLVRCRDQSRELLRFIHNVVPDDQFRRRKFLHIAMRIAIVSMLMPMVVSVRSVLTCHHRFTPV
jgi:hypothetical protein